MSCPDQTEILNVSGSITKCEDAAKTCVAVDTPIYYASSDDGKCLLLGAAYNPDYFVELNFNTWDMVSAVNPVGFKCSVDGADKKSCVADKQLTDSLQGLLSRTGTCAQYVYDSSVQPSNFDDYAVAGKILSND